MHHVTMVLPLDAAFEAERNEQTDRDGGQMVKMSRQLWAA
jgi:hypothetical protein